MKTKPLEINDKILDKIISAAYGDAGFLDTIYVKKIINKHENAKLLFEQYSAVAKEVHKLKEEEFSVELLKLPRIKNLTNKEITNSFWIDLLSIIINRPLISTLAALIIISVITLSLINNKQIEYRYTPAEITLVEEQARKALDVVGKVFSETKITIRNEVLGEKVGNPIRKSMGIVNIIFNKGE